MRLSHIQRRTRLPGGRVGPEVAVMVAIFAPLPRMVVRLFRVPR